MGADRAREWDRSALASVTDMAESASHVRLRRILNVEPTGTTQVTAPSSGPPGDLVPLKRLDLDLNSAGLGVDTRVTNRNCEIEFPKRASSTTGLRADFFRLPATDRPPSSSIDVDTEKTP